MKLIVLGDSIVRGTFTKKGEQAPLSSVKRNFSRLLAERLGADKLICLGYNGVSVSRTSPVNSDFALSVICEKAVGGDMVLVAGGTNDYGNSVEIGSAENREDISFYGGLDVLCSVLKANNPNAEICMILPIRRSDEQKENFRGYKLDDYREAMKTKAEEYAFRTIDGRKLPIDPSDSSDRDNYMSDGLHPNEEGHRIYADFLYNEIRKFRLEKK